MLVWYHRYSTYNYAYIGNQLLLMACLKEHLEGYASVILIMLETLLDPRLLACLPSVC